MKIEACRLEYRETCHNAFVVMRSCEQETFLPDSILANDALSKANGVEA